MILLKEQAKELVRRRKEKEMKPLIIYHAHCTDGFGAAYAAWCKFGDMADYLPINYGDQEHSDVDVLQGKIGTPDNRQVYVLDFSFPIDTTKWLIKNSAFFVWLDHHKTAFEMWAGDEREFYLDETEYTNILLDNSKSGALLAWEYFHPKTVPPILIKHIDDRDRWQFKMDGSKEIHAALQTEKPWTFDRWDVLTHEDSYTSLLNQGRAIIKAQEQQVQSTSHFARSCKIGDAKGLAVNTNVHISEVGHELAKKSGAFGLIWYLNTENRANCSLRSEGDYDVSAIAKQFGGGGHKNAAGFNTDVSKLLEFLQ